MITTNTGWYNKEMTERVAKSSPIRRHPMPVITRVKRIPKLYYKGGVVYEYEAYDEIMTFEQAASDTKRTLPYDDHGVLHIEYYSSIKTIVEEELQHRRYKRMRE